MKERSGRSYEALARRAGTSSSAVHRYCTGRTVPASFEVLQRLGGACGMNRAELLELHRHWAVALAAREDNGPKHQAEPPAEPLVGVLAGSPAGSPTQAQPASPPLPDQRAGLADAGPPTGSSSRRARRQPALAFAAATVLVLTVWAAARWSPAGSSATTLYSPDCSPTVSPGDHGSCVREVQRLLTNAGAALPADGRYGTATLSEVTAFRVLAGLPASGVVDDATKRALYAGTTHLSTLNSDQVGQKIRQTFLEEPVRAVRIATCTSNLNPYYVAPIGGGKRSWGVFQISDDLLQKYHGTPLQALDPDWNIQTAHHISLDRGFGDWSPCDSGAAAGRPVVYPA
jgi:hypothetical protein